MTSFWAAASAVAVARGSMNLAPFFAALCACCALFIASVYAASLLFWRLCRAKTLCVVVRHPPKDILPGESCQISISIENPFCCTWILEDFSCQSTSHIEIVSSCSKKHLMPRQYTELLCAIEAKLPGPAAIVGVGFAFSDPFALFHMEYHRELNIHIDVLPIDTSSNGIAVSRAVPKYLMPWSGSAASCQSPNGGIGLRPYQKFDTFRKIFWRGYARWEELMVTGDCSSFQKNICILIDIAPWLRHQITAHPSDAFQSVASLVFLSDQCTILACGGDAVAVTAFQETAETALDHWNRWFIKALEMRPPLKTSNASAAAWSELASRLHADYKRYSHVDFSKETPNGIEVSFYDLCAWQRTRWISQAALRGDTRRAEYFAGMDYHACLVEVLRERRDWPKHAYAWMVGPMGAPSEAIQKICGEFLDSPVQCFAWLSDFTDPVETETAALLQKWLVKQNAIGIALKIETQDADALEANVEKNFQNLQFLHWQVFKSGMQAKMTKS